MITFTNNELHKINCSGAQLLKLTKLEHQHVKMKCQQFEHLKTFRGDIYII